MKVGITVVTHQGKLRPNGQELISRFVESCYDIEHDVRVFVYDNASETPIKLDYDICEIIRVDDQMKRGLTGAWNDGVNKSVSENCDIVIVSNDDVTLNSSVNRFIDYIVDDNVVYGPLSNGILSGVQKSYGVKTGLIELTGNIHNMVNGFFFGMTNSFVMKYRMENSYLFDEENFPWGGNEEEFQRRIWNQGGRSIVVNECFIEHTKIRGWRQLM